MKFFYYSNDINKFKEEGSYFGLISSNLDTKESLLKDLYIKLDFPGYFGFNWDALYDCLRDFDWVSEKNIIIYHSKLPNIEKKDLKIYLDILYDSCHDWKPDEKHSLKVVFPSDSEEKIKKFLGVKN